jgi:murein DD-endopeptidase MepM/ murein hydrolase activator NlpD
MPPPVRTRRTRAAQRRHLERERRLRRLAVLVVIVAIGLVTLLLSAFGGSDAPAPATAPASASRLLPAGPPLPELVARLGSALRLQLPVSQSRVTAIGYHGGSDGALALSPLGTQVNQGLLKRLVHKVFGGPSGRPRWYQLPGGEGPASSAIDVGAAPGTDVYSPVDGIIVAIEDVMLNGRTYGSRVDIQPSAAPSLVVTVSHVRVDPSLAVGSPVTSAGSKLGSIVDFSRAEQQALSRYTNDAGNHVVVEVHPAPTPSLN